MRIFPLLFLVFVIFHSCKQTEDHKTESSPLSEDQLSKIDSICQSFIDKGNTVGLSVGLSHNGKVIFSKGYGLANIASGKPATDSTIYAIASISKFITAITTMKLVEEGKLNLSDKVVDHIKDFPRQEFMNEITIEHLLRHQSGLVDHEDWFDSIYINHKRVFTDEEFFKFLDQPLFFKPGTRYSYSNSGYAILSMILEKTEGKSFHELIVDKINNPVGASSIGMWPERWNLSNATMGFELGKQGVDTSFHMMTKGMKGDGGLSASVLDLLKLANALSDEKFLKKSSLEKMISPSPIGNILIDYGLGVKFGNYSGQKTFGHSGGYKGTGWAMLSLYPESGYAFAAAINTNFSPEEVWNLRHFIMPVVLNVKPPEMEEKPVNNIKKFTGIYSAFNRWGNEKPDQRSFYVENGNLFYDNPDTKAPGIQLYPVNDSVFAMKVYPFDEIRFQHANGKVAAYTHYYDGLFGAVRMKN